MDILKIKTEPAGRERERMITLRLPNSVWSALKTAAYDHKTSLNQFCITTLKKSIPELLKFHSMQSNHDDSAIERIEALQIDHEGLAEAVHNMLARIWILEQRLQLSGNDKTTTGNYST